MSVAPVLCLVEDDPTIRELVAVNLRDAGFVVNAFEAAEKLQGNLSEYGDLFILDVRLAGEENGLELCERVRSQSPTLPILVLSALGEPTDRVEGLRRGADDYLNKPFEMDELLLRVKGMLRRRSWYQLASAASSGNEWPGGKLDLAALELQTARGRRTPLSMKEALLLKLLLDKRGQVVTRDEILDRVWGYDAYPSTRTVDNFIVRLRKVLEEDPKNPKYILSVRGVGYKFNA